MRRLALVLVIATVVIGAGAARADQPPECSGIEPAYYAGLAMLQARREEHEAAMRWWWSQPSYGWAVEYARFAEWVRRDTVAIASVCSQQAWTLSREHHGGR